MHSLDSKTVVITGASRGIGAAAAVAFAEAGARVALLARDLDACQKTAASLESAGHEALAIRCDVADYGNVDAALQQCVDHFGQLDVMVNNAGVIDPIGLMESVDPAAWSDAVDINLKGTFNGMHAALPHLLAAGGGTVLNVSSGAAQTALAGWSHYCAAKAACSMLTRCTHVEYQDRAIRVMGLSPGTVATDMQVKIKASGINAVSKLDPNVHIDPSWPARAMVWMCSPDAAVFAGQEIALRDPDIRARIGLT